MGTQTCQASGASVNHMYLQPKKFSQKSEAGPPTHLLPCLWEWDLAGVSRPWPYGEITYSASLPKHDLLIPQTDTFTHGDLYSS